jgi:acetyl esterase/lipase
MQLDLSGSAETIRLWPEGPPTVIDGVGPEVTYAAPPGLAAGTPYQRNISDPSLTVFAPAEGSGNGRGVVVIPGGGWTINVVAHEGTDVARWLVGEGYTAFLLKYRVQASPDDQAEFEALPGVGDGIHTKRVPHEELPASIRALVDTKAYHAARDAAADDGRRALTIAREIAPRYGVRPETVGLLGFSAGAFLCVDLALDPQGDQPAFIAPIYGGETRGAAVPADAPPLFTAVAQDDILLRIVEGLYADWSAADTSSEIHVFAEGQHGFGIVRQGKPVDLWTTLFLAWMRSLEPA